MSNQTPAEPGETGQANPSPRKPSPDSHLQSSAFERFDANRLLDSCNIKKQSQNLHRVQKPHVKDLKLASKTSTNEKYVINRGMLLYISDWVCDGGATV